MATEEKILIVERLLESKAITFREALKLLETEKEYVYQYWPTVQPFTFDPINPWAVSYDVNNAPQGTFTTNN